MMDMNKPVFPAPAGYIVDILHPQRSGEAPNIWVGTVGMIISSLFMEIRLYTKIKLAKNFTADDGMYHLIINSAVGHLSLANEF
jgi:hypothetical protein